MMYNVSIIGLGGVDMSKVKVQISLTDDIKKYMDSEAKRCGLNFSAFITMCVLQYRKQDESILLMSEMGNIISELSKSK